MADTIINADPIAIAVTQAGAASTGFNVLASPIPIAVMIKGVATGFAGARNPDLDIVWRCQGYDTAGNPGRGIIRIGTALSGDILNRNIFPDPIIIAITPSGIPIPGLVLEGKISISVSITGDPWLIPIGDCWVWTSKIGSMDFTEDLTGEATKRPMKWSGYIYHIKKLGGSAIVYGSNGISRLTPQGVNWGLSEVWPVGLKARNAVVELSGKDIHKFIDASGRLCTLNAEGPPQAVDYSNYFSAMGMNLVMTHDGLNDLVFVADGISGYVISDMGIGKGPATITGMGYKDGYLYAASSEELVFAPFEICTDIVDFGSREEKTINEVDLGVAATNDLWVAIDYRWNKASAFVTSPWVKADRQGRAFPMVSGVEFRIRVKLLVYESISLDYIKVHGQVAGVPAEVAA